MICHWDQKLRKRLHVLEADIMKIEKNIDLMSLAQRVHFLPDVFQMADMALLSVIHQVSYQWFASILKHTV